MNQLRTQLFQIKNTFLPIKQYKDVCLQFDEKLSQYIDGNNIDYFYLRELLKVMEQQKIGSSNTVSKALNILLNKEKDDIRQQQKILTLAALNNLCNQVETTIDIKQITASNLVPNFLLYLALTENDALVELCKADKLKNLRMYYYLQYMRPQEFNFIRNDTVQIESVRQKEYEKEIKEKYIKEHRIGLYKCDFYLPNSNTVIEVNGHAHYIHFKDRRSGLYQQKYNYLLKKGYKVMEVE